MSFKDAQRYDSMINWETRLNREIPMITGFFEKGTILDMACSSGRHSLALEKEGFTCVGVDVEPGFIELAKELRGEANAKFVCVDGTSGELFDKVREVGYSYFDNAILLGNAIANMGTRERTEQLLRNIYMLLRPSGKLFVQTVNRPITLHYIPLRKVGENVIQRIMVPYQGDEPHNTELQINVIKGLQYLSHERGNKFFMYTSDEFEQLVQKQGFNIKARYGGYNKEGPSEEGGSTVVWLLQKSEVVLSEDTLRLFNMTRDEIMELVLPVWQDIFRELPYRCIASMRFLHPRITSHPMYLELDLVGKRILDLGCALGTDLVQMIHDGASANQCTGLDRSELVLRTHAKLFGSTGVRLLCGDATDTHAEELGGEEVDIYKDGFDIIFTGSLLHLLTEEEVQQLCINVYDGLHNGGIFLGRMVVMKERAQPDPYYQHVFTMDELRVLLEDIGFTGVDLRVHGESHGACERSYGDHLTISFWAIK